MALEQARSAANFPFIPIERSDKIGIRPIPL
jgi:hypothetical protein